MRTTSSFTVRSALAALSFVAVAAPFAHGQDSGSDIKDLRAEIQALEQKLAILERKEEIRSDDAAAAAKTTAKVTVNDKNGFVVSSGDGSSYVHIGGLVQLDSREFFGDGGGVLNNGFALRRARLISDGVIDKIYTFQFVPEFGGTSAVSIFDANVGINLNSALQFKFGKFKSPIGLEQLQADPYTNFAERSLATNLVPNRDLGAQVGGTLAGGIVTYQAALLNGVADAANTTNADFDNDKDVDGRVIITPFATDKDSALHGLGVGVAASLGREKGATALTSGYKTDGQQTFFKYNAAVVADGQVWRVSPQGYYYVGPFSALAEYVVSTVNVRPTATGTKTELENKAWDAQLGWVLTGEDATYAGVTPRTPFDWQNGTWGAFQVVGRYADLKIDPNAFPLFASATTNAQEAKAWGLGLNWYLSRPVRISVDYFDTQFENPVPVSGTQILRQNEKALTTRVQIYF